MFCNALVCLHCVHRQGLRRDCYESCFHVDFCHFMFESRLTTTCSRCLSSFALPEHTKPSTHHTTHTVHMQHEHNTLPYTFTVHTHQHNSHNTSTTQTKHTHTHTTDTDRHTHTQNTQKRRQNRQTHITTHIHNTLFIVFGGLRFMLLLKALSRSRSVWTCDGEAGQFINVEIIFAKT